MSTVETIGDVRTAAEILAWSRSSVQPALRAAVDTLPGSLRRIAGYHFGWLDERGAPADGDGGKALRPALVLLCAEAVGGGPRAVPAAVAVELVHNFSLLHDDVMDGDATRRHRATAWHVFGTGAAILAGDALLTLAMDVLSPSGQPSLRVLGNAVQDLVEGQIADLAFEKRIDVTVPECVRMAERKTGALLGASCALGALAGGADAERANELRQFGEQLGLAFQFIDDLLGIWGDPSVTGKPVHNDLRSRKKSLPVVSALTSGTPAGAELIGLYQAESLTEAGLARAAELVELAGGRAWSRTQADDLLGEARERLHAADPEPRAAIGLETLAKLATHRDH
ncbi:family 2 encapsulin nanocompartment cargo protein polyprenyl transferase [Amycolatopsis sp. 195334CR]|uniref:family 2 encapsulin nanocompartment cargo protein polyprenyl transferase n=1 Tax=Amycolatopsis sp. 195334CR TaxID=2814588 RepID=UPI001A8DFA18|nr:family 2 encapsulin nanocompartment cargo protein polyprenyl transferase [Amycolatopsis sp. 195334CR]MBN6039256.1 polyprenyl synthetase family protein [Amycolatopsis sp. 195334CR]